MNKSSTFQIVIIAVFSAFILAGFFALYFTKSKNKDKDVATEVVLWGTIPGFYVSNMEKAVQAETAGIKINYREIKEDNFDSTLIEALASGRGPDAILISHDLILRYQDKIYPIPANVLSERGYVDSYISIAELFMSPWGYLGMPFSVDPMVMYWNRDMFSSAGIATPPRFWDEFYRLSEALTEKTENVEIKRSAVALGEFNNVNNAKEIISAMSMQAGVYPVSRGNDGYLKGGINENFQSVIDFYVEFANQSKAVYSWNRSLPNSLDMFAKGDLAVYFGFVSEANQISEKNPNLDFDISYFPQPRDAKTKITFGKTLGVSVLRWSSKVDTAIKLAMLFSSQEGVKAWHSMTTLPPIRRDLLGTIPSDTFNSVSFSSALWSKGWLDPDYKQTKTLFREMIDAINSGWMTSGSAINNMNTKLVYLLTGKQPQPTE